ncbi:MAG: shikimate dehydrogenase, partial [Novosphingobium sp.]
MNGLYAEVIGDPVAHSKSPLIHRFWLGKLGIDADYRTFHVRPAELAGYVARRREDAGWRGCNVTIPHKQAIVPLADRLAPEASRVGAVNTLVATGADLIGHNTDVAGIREALAGLMHAGAERHRIEVIGSGGAARAAAAAFPGAAITFVNRSLDKAEQLAGEVSQGSGSGRAESLAEWRAGAAPHDCTIAVNASSMGMAGQPEVPIDLRRYAPDTIVFDMVYAPLETGLLRAARQRGMRTVDGLAMLVGQAAAA